MEKCRETYNFLQIVFVNALWQNIVGKRYEKRQSKQFLSKALNVKPAPENVVISWFLSLSKRGRVMNRRKREQPQENINYHIKARQTCFRQI
jgi:hypothetical protein